MKVKVHIGRGQREGNGEHVVMYICARTTARIRRDADQEHEGQDPEMRSHINLRILMHCFASSLYLRVCDCAYLCLSLLSA